MSNTSSRRKAQRRDFLKGMAVAGGGVALAASTGVTLAEPAIENPPTPARPGSLGYQDTAHVREYYAKARF